MSKRILAGLAVAAIAMLPLAGHADPTPEGCALVAGQGVASGSITEAGAANGIVAGGSWTVDVTHADGSTTHYGDTHGVPQDIMNAFVPGDDVTCTADQGFVIAGRAG